MPRRNLGEFEQLVLLACLRLAAGERHTAAILEELEATAGRKTSHARVYLALRRLEDKRLVKSTMGPSSPRPGGKPKRYFEVTPQAVRMLRESRDSLLQMWKGVEPIET